VTALINNGPLQEHHGHPNGLNLSAYHQCGEWLDILYKNCPDKPCVSFKYSSTGERSLHTSYYIGLDWLETGKLAVYVEPKMNNDRRQTDYFKMLFHALSNPQVNSHVEDLFEIKMKEPHIKINQSKDLITPLLILQFLELTSKIVKKGLKKSYNTVSNNLKGRIKGKLLVPKSIKMNSVKGKVQDAYCQYTVFDVNGIENRVLKKAISFCRRYLDNHQLAANTKYFQHLLAYITPAFQFVTTETENSEIRNVKQTSFFKEYKAALRLAELIFKRYGYNIGKVKPENEIVSVPPFWIDMSKLFELYTLSLLRDRFASNVLYHFGNSANELDFLLDHADYKLVIDAKYKPFYSTGIDHQDVRQVSGYSRLDVVYDRLGYSAVELIRCLIIYPLDSGMEHFKGENFKYEPIAGYKEIYKLGIKLPLVGIGS